MVLALKFPNVVRDTNEDSATGFDHFWTLVRLEFLESGGSANLLDFACAVRYGFSVWVLR